MHTRRLYLPFAIILPSCCAVLSSAGAAESQQVRVVLPAQPTAVEQFAAEELARCLTTACGCRVQSISDAQAPQDAPTFWVGTIETPSRLAALPAERVAAKADELVDDGVFLHSDGANVVLIGKGRRGALNAVYTYLERQIGFHWPEPSRELTPSGARLNLDALDMVSNPALRYRGIAIHGACGPEWFTHILDWLAKNRMNSFQLFPGHYEQLRDKVLGDVLKRGLYPNIGGHSREFFFPAHKYFPQHPEWFALVKDRRVRDTQICYSDLSSVHEYATNVIEYLKTRPEIGMASLWPSDGYGFCECDKCKAGHVTDTILGYCNAVTREVNAALPDIETEFLSYIHYTVPPKDVEPEPQLVPTYCEYWSRSQFHTIIEDRSGNAKCREELKAWIAASKDVTLFSYYGDDCIKRFVYNPLMDMIGEDVRYYRTIGLAGNFVLLTNPESWWSNAPHLYAYTRFAWDPDTPLATVEADYYDSLYGSVSPAMKAHAEASRALFDMQTAQGNRGEDIVWGQSYPLIDAQADTQTRAQGAAAVDKLHECLRQAEATQPDPYVAERVRKLHADADYLGWLFEFISQARRTEQENTPEAKQRLLSLAEKGLELEVVAEDDRKGYRSARNVLLSTTRRLTGTEPEGTHGSPASRAQYKESGIWQWRTEDIVPSSKDKPRRIVIDVTDRIRSAGTYEVIWQYLDGADGLFILSTGLYTADAASAGPDDLKPLVVDEHDGFTGGGNSRNVYTLALPDYDAQKRYYVMGVVYDEREFDTFGHVLLRRQP